MITNSYRQKVDSTDCDFVTSFALYCKSIDVYQYYKWHKGKELRNRTGKGNE